jgi:hypothetical protein
MYWLYRRPGGNTLVLSLDPNGRVTQVTLAGKLPYPAGRTTRNIGLGDDYMKIISQYGYPDQSVTGGSTIQLIYVDHMVRFTLEGMRVNEIAIGTPVTAGVEVTPEAQTPATQLPPAGLSPEELRGYM